MKTDYKLIENREAKRFELHVEGNIAFIDYTIKQDKIYLTHAEVPKKLGGRGIGSVLVKRTLEALEDSNLKVVPDCSFVVSYIDRHPEWEPLS